MCKARGKTRTKTGERRGEERGRGRGRGKTREREKSDERADGRGEGESDGAKKRRVEIRKGRDKLIKYNTISYLIRLILEITKYMNYKGKQK